MSYDDRRLTFRTERARIALYLAQARVALAEAVPVLMVAERQALTDQHREEVEALEDLHASCIAVCRMLAR